MKPPVGAAIIAGIHYHGSGENGRAAVSTANQLDVQAHLAKEHDRAVDGLEPVLADNMSANPSNLLWSAGLKVVLRPDGGAFSEPLTAIALSPKAYARTRAITIHDVPNLSLS